MIELKHISKSFGKKELFNDLSYTFKPEGITAVLGPNGSGKTTMLKMILGLYFPDSGSIKYKGQELHSHWKNRESISYLPQQIRFPENLSVKELINMMTDLRDANANAGEWLEHFEVDLLLNNKVGTLSGGQKQKLNFCLALMFPSDLLILDEPSAGLDPVTMIKVKEAIRTKVKEGKRVLFTTHIIDLVQHLADDIVFLLDGEITYNGRPDELIIQEKANNLEEAIASLMLKIKS